VKINLFKESEKHNFLEILVICKKGTALF